MNIQGLQPSNVASLNLQIPTPLLAMLVTLTEPFTENLPCLKKTLMSTSIKRTMYCSWRPKKLSAISLSKTWT